MNADEGHMHSLLIIIIPACRIQTWDDPVDEEVTGDNPFANIRLMRRLIAGCNTHTLIRNLVRQRREKGHVYHVSMFETIP